MRCPARRIYTQRVSFIGQRAVKRKVLVFMLAVCQRERARWMYTVSRWGDSVARWSTNWRADYLSNALVPGPTRWIDHRRAGSPRNITCSCLCGLSLNSVILFWQVKFKFHEQNVALRWQRSAPVYKLTRWYNAERAGDQAAELATVRRAVHRRSRAR